MVWLYEKIPDEKVDVSVQMAFSQWDRYDHQHREELIGYYLKLTESAPKLAYYIIGFSVLKVEVMMDGLLHKLQSSQ